MFLALFARAILVANGRKLIQTSLSTKGTFLAYIIEVPEVEMIIVNTTVIIMYGVGGYWKY